MVKINFTKSEYLICEFLAKIRDKYFQKKEYMSRYMVLMEKVI